MLQKKCSQYYNFFYGTARHNAARLAEMFILSHSRKNEPRK